MNRRGGRGAGAALEAEIIEAIARRGPPDEARFDGLALRLFDFQYHANPFYGRLCDAAGGGTPASWREIPAIPAGAFKRAEIRCFPAEETAAVFHTSGTTATETGRHLFRSLAAYEESLSAGFRDALLPDGARMRMLILTPRASEAPHSSLVHMMETVVTRFGRAGTRFFVSGGTVDVAAFVGAAGECSRTGEPALLMGTAFALATVLDAMGTSGTRMALPPASRIMETGGFKGRTREMDRTGFYAMLSEAFGVPPWRIVSEYGMTELSSQFYDGSLVSGRATATKFGPAWARALVVDPLSGVEVEEGATGLVRVVDLANVWSAVAIQTEDVAIRRPGGAFELLGRVAAAPARGCSLAAESLRVAAGPPTRG